MRPLGIPSVRDKVIQKAAAILLQVIYEPEFLSCSHGFRPKCSTHTALEQISKWTGIHWVIEGDIRGYFYNVDHNKLALE